MVHGHHFRATHYTLPPVCSVCQKLIIGVGKSVYLCELCGTECHKNCHIAVGNCAMRTEGKEAGRG